MFRTNAPFRRVAALGAAALIAGGLAVVSAPAHAVTATYKVLVFSKTTGFRHDSMPAGITAIQNLGVQNGFAVDATENDALFTDANLAQYKTVIFLSATGDPVSTQAEKDAFQRYIQAGGGYVGIHAASDSGYSWSFYGGLVGAYFQQHPAIQTATVRIEDSNFPATSGLPTSFSRTDEWYDFQTNPRARVHVLTNVDNSSYTGSTMGTDHPNTWCQNYAGGRSFYTAWGHSIASYSEANFLHVVLGGIQWTAGQVAGNCAVPVPSAPVISLRAHANGKFVTSDTAGTSPLIASSTTNGTNQQFDEVDAGGGMIALRAHADSKYVVAENAGASSLIANRTAIGPWEMFTLLRNGDGSVSFRSNTNGKLVTAENAGASALIANRTAVGQWEEFDLITN